MKIHEVSLTAAGVLAFLAGSAAATTLNFSNPGSDTERAEVTCTLGCEAWYISGEDYTDGDWSNGFWNIPDGTLFSRGIVPGGNDNNPGSRLAVTNLALGESYTDLDRTETGGDAQTWTSSAETLLVWIGTQGQPSDSFRYAFIRNYSANNEFTWSGLPGGGGDKSGYDGFGVIPLPAAGWMLLAGIGGLAAMKRRKKADA